MSQMNTRQHHVSRNGETLGPWTVAEIAEKLAVGAIQITDFAWDDSVQDWIPLLEFGELRIFLQSRKPVGPPTSKKTKPEMTEPVIATSKALVPVATIAKAAAHTAIGPAMSADDAIEWYVSRENQKFGPFNYFGVIKALQDKSIFEFDHVWKEGMESWVRIAEHERFNANAVKSLIGKMETAETKKTVGAEVFAQRKHPRLQVENEVLIHDNKTVSPGKMVEGSSGGVGVIINNSTLMPGQMIYLHFASIDGLPAFNSLGEVVSKKFSRSVRDARTPIHYGIRFVKMDPTAEDRVRSYFKARLAASASRA